MTSDQGPELKRRTVLQASGAIGLGVAGAAALPGWRAGAEPGGGRDYALRATYDWAAAYFDEHAETQPDRPNEFRGSLAWGQSYVLRSYLAMYRGFGDEDYLDLLCRNVDAILDIRDSVRGVADWRGESLPVWRAWAPYTAGRVDVAAADGTPLLQLRTGVSYADDISVEVLAGEGDRFGLAFTNTASGQTERYDDLTMQRAGSDYVVTRLLDAAPAALRGTAVDLRKRGSGAAQPRPGVYPMESHYVTFSVHTGMITAPIAEFCRIVRADPRLWRRYGVKAVRYLRAVRRAVDCHDEEYHENEQGEGWYAWPKGAPLAFDGCEMPHNQFLALATVQLHLAALTGHRPYRQRAVGMLRTFRNDLRRAGDSYVWSYWWSKGHVYNGFTVDDDVSEWTPAYGAVQSIEDGSHGAVSVETVLAARELGLVFDEADVRRFAATYTDNLMAYDENGDARVWYCVDGTRELGLQDLQAPRWVNLAGRDQRIFDHAREIFNREQPVPDLGSALLGTAYLAAHHGS